MKGCQEHFSGQSGLGLLRNQILSFSVCVRQRDREETDSLAVKMWGNAFCKLLTTVLEQGDHRLLSEMVLCAETERERLCTAQLVKGTILPSRAQNGQVIALISFLCPRKISSKLCPEWRAGAPSRQLEAVLKGGQPSPCVAQPQQGNAAKIPLCHRIIEWFGLEGTLKLIQFQPPCHGQGHLPLDQVAQNSIQPGQFTH